MAEGDAAAEEHPVGGGAGAEIRADPIDRPVKVSGDAAAIRRLWSIVDASGLETAWQAFGSRLDWQNFEMTQ